MTTSDQLFMGVPAYLETILDVVGDINIVFIGACQEFTNMQATSPPMWRIKMFSAR